MNFTVEQKFEIGQALHFGLSRLAWDRLTAAQQTDHLEQAHRLRLEHLAQETRPEHRRAMEEELKRSQRPEDIEQRMRERFYASSPRERARNTSGWTDLLSQAGYFSAEQRQAVDRRLREKGLPSLHALSAKLRRVHAGILKRQKIRSDEEYYVVKEIISDMALEIPEVDRAAFEALAAAYEAKAGKS